MRFLFCLLISTSALANSLILDATTKSLEMETSAAVSTDYVVSYTDNTTTTFTPGMNQGNVNTATTTAILAAPAASTQRQVKWVSVRNRSTTTAQTVTLKLDVSATEYHLSAAVTLGAGESMYLNAEGKVTCYDRSGQEKISESPSTGYSGVTYSFLKNGTAPDAIGYYYAYGAATGFPGAWVPGTPGLNGTNTDCSTAAGATIAGAPLIADPSSGSLYLTSAGMGLSVANNLQLIDVLWFNTGAVVTTTTAQTITMAGALPARDQTGTTNGEGVFAALFSSAANTNAAVIANTTISYTNSDGTAGRTGTFTGVVGLQAPATPVIGTWVPFQLAAGDRGIRSVQSITLGTSYVTGSLSLVLYRPLVTIPNPVANVGGSASVLLPSTPPGVRLYNDTCIWPIFGGASAATAAVLSGTVTVMER